MPHYTQTRHTMPVEWSHSTVIYKPALIQSKSNVGITAYCRLHTQYITANTYHRCLTYWYRDFCHSNPHLYYSPSLLESNQGCSQAFLYVIISSNVLSSYSWSLDEMKDNTEAFLLQCMDTGWPSHRKEMRLIAQETYSWLFCWA